MRMWSKFNKKIKNVFQIIIVITIGSMAFYSVFQVLKNVFSPPRKEFGPADRAEDFVKRAKLHWEKNKLILPHDDFLPISDQHPLNQNENYFLLETVNQNGKGFERCYFGNFKLSSLNYDHFIFSSERGRKNSKLEIFSNLNSKKVMFQILDQDQFLKQSFVKNCKNWTHIQNLSDFVSSKNKNGNKKVTIFSGKCVSLSMQKYIDVISHDSKIIHIEENPQTGKIDLCGIQQGFSLIELQSRDGESSSFLAISQSTQGNQKKDVKRHAEKGKLFDGQLDQSKLLSGWKK